MTPPRLFKGCLTAWAIQYVIANWHFCVCRELAGGRG